jgi:hypothetical protein
MNPKLLLTAFFVGIFCVSVNAQTNTFPTSGNAGIGTTTPAAKLSFANVSETSDAIGLTWYNPGPLDYGIYRTPGSWTAPHFQQLKLQFKTGIILQPGSDHGKSYVDIQGGGLRVTSGSVGIGTTSPGGKVDINHAGAQLRLSGGTVAGGVWTSTGDILYMADWNTGAKGLNINMTTGNIGIGGTPSAKLDVVGPTTGSGPTIRASGGGDVLMNSAGSLFFDGNYSYSTGNYIRPVTANTQAFFTAGSERLRITSSGNVGIGTTSPNEKLTVNGVIYGREVKIDLNVPAPDYVFEKDYNLPSLEEIKSYIDQHKHLPEVPSAKEMEANGINVGEMNMILLKKLEEITLHLIDLKEENKKQQREIEILKHKD